MRRTATLCACALAAAALAPSAAAARDHVSYREARSAVRSTLRATQYGYSEGSLDADCWHYRRGRYDRARCLLSWRDRQDAAWKGCARVVERDGRHQTTLYRVIPAADPRSTLARAGCA